MFDFGFKGSGFSLLIMVQLRGFGNSLHHQRWLRHYIGLRSVITVEKEKECVAKSVLLQQITVVVSGQV